MPTSEAFQSFDPKAIFFSWINNIQRTFSQYDLKHYVRFTAIIGGYLILRPHIQALGAKFQERDHAREIDVNEESSHAATGSRKQVVNDADAWSEDEDDDSWGVRKRKVQRAEKKRLQKEQEEAEDEEESDKEIEEFLTK